MSRITIKQVNKTIAPLGYELCKGNGYFYFWPLGEGKQLYDDSVIVNTLSALSVEEWKRELLYKLDDCRNQ